MNVPPSVILSRPDNLGDAVVTLTMAGWLKHHAPDTRITVIAQRYTQPVWNRCVHAGATVTLEELESAPAGARELMRAIHAEAIVHAFPHRRVARWAAGAGIRRRIGTSRRWWHWLTCNERVSFSRRRSDLHEAQLNIKLLEPFGVPMPRSVAELVPHIGYDVPPASAIARSVIRPGRRNVILHPLSKGSAAEWGLENFAALIALLDPATYHCIITGTAEDAARYSGALPAGAAHVTDTGGKLTLGQLMELIGASSALVAASTGPLHIAAASGIRTVGLFSMRRPVFPARWAPIGRDVHVLVNDPSCPRCFAGEACDCITRIAPERVAALID